MRCSVVQRFLLEQAHPERPPAAVRGHLEECPVCRAWHERLVEMERRVPLLSVPSSETARAAFLQQIVAATTEEKAPPRRRGWQVRERALQKLSLAASLAAALLLFALCWWVVQNTPEHPAIGPSYAAKPNPPPVPPGIPVQADSQDEAQQRRRVHINQLVAERGQPQTPSEYVRRYREVAVSLFDKVKQSRDREERRELVQVYLLLVQEELPERARQVAKQDRDTVLRPMVEYLGHLQSDAAQLRDELRKSGEDPEPLNQLALAAEKSGAELSRLIQEAAA